MRLYEITFYTTSADGVWKSTLEEVRVVANNISAAIEWVKVNRVQEGELLQIKQILTDDQEVFVVG